jgi:L-seryl-tRNA(Ser) seleniumtransferase
MPDSNLSERLRALPSVDALLRTPEASALRGRVGAEHLSALARAVTEEMRAELRADGGESSEPDVALAREALLAEAARRLALSAGRERGRGLRRVINATGVVLHTNLGRAPLSEAARLAVAREAAGYCTLEYDTAAGARGRRGARAEELLAELTGAEEASWSRSAATSACPT